MDALKGTQANGGHIGLILDLTLFRYVLVWMSSIEYTYVKATCRRSVQISRDDNLTCKLHHGSKAHSAFLLIKIIDKIAAFNMIDF